MDLVLYYLIMNGNGFEEPLRVGTREELETEKIELEKMESLNGKGEKVTYYLVPKWEWDIEHCPLMPVDLSERS
jgi:hypothetical protein